MIVSENSTSTITNHRQYNIEGVFRADCGKFLEAKILFSKAIELDPDNYVAYFNRASVKMKLGDIEGAIADFRISENLDPISEKLES